MPKFLAKERMACWITWTYKVEAEDIEAAWERYGEGEHSAVIGQPEIGDSLDFVGNDVDIIPAEE
jgi:hypothetical protein